MDDYYYDYNEQFYDDDSLYADDDAEDDHLGTGINQSFIDIFDACVYPSLMQISSYIGTFLLWNLVYRITTQTVNISSRLQHSVSIICGALILHKTIGNGAIYYLVFTLSSYIILLICWIVTVCKKRCGLIVSVFCLTALIIGEFLCDDTKLWHQIRGTQMIVAMKVISLAFDTTIKRNQLPPIDQPNIIEYYGYIMCPANCVLGPWIPYKEYAMNFKAAGKWQPKWIIWITMNVLCSVICLIMSNCIIGWFFTDKSWKWTLAYRNAMAFRFSHYFVSFLSQSMMLMAGFFEPQDQDCQTSAKMLGYRITKPWLIEMPRSIVQVVVAWNISMHIWLKTYVFRVTKPYGIFAAIFSTYIISALLHGINFQLAAVLLSLGTYTYVEYKLRQKLASIYDACIAANACKTRAASLSAGSVTACSHNHKWHNPYVLIVNGFFGLLTIAHLAYLGVMFEASTNIQEQGFSYEHTLKKWSSLDYGSHWIVLVSYIFYILI